MVAPELAAGLLAAGAARAAGALAAAGLADPTALVWVWAARRARQAEAGSLLAEVALASALLTLVIGSLLNLFTSALAATVAAGERTVALNLARTRLEILRENPAAGGAGTDPDSGMTWVAGTGEPFADPYFPAVTLQRLQVTVGYNRGGDTGRPAALSLGTLRGEGP